jgi:hypothetical protein
MGLLLALTVPCALLSAADPGVESPLTHPQEVVAGATNPTLQAAVQKLDFPGVTINLQERCVDLEGSVCLNRGALELVACTKGTKEHESIVAITARPMHVHAALLLLGAKPGSPATREPVGDASDRWRDVPPSGGPVEVFLVLKGEEGKPVELPINEFIAPSRRRSEASAGEPGPRFPTHTFVFAGSVLQTNGSGPRRYLCDESGNLISLSTFGDEVLCLPSVHSQDNEALLWQVAPTKLPAVGSDVILRLRPQLPSGGKAPKAKPPIPTSAPDPVQRRPIP